MPSLCRAACAAKRYCARQEVFFQPAALLLPAGWSWSSEGRKPTPYSGQSDLIPASLTILAYRAVSALICASNCAGVDGAG